MAATKKMTESVGYHECSRCHERIAVGSYYVRSGSSFTHSSECAAPVSAPVTAPVAAPSRPGFAVSPTGGLDLTDPHVRMRLGLDVRDDRDTFLAGLPSLDSLSED